LLFLAMSDIATTVDGEMHSLRRPSAPAYSRARSLPTNILPDSRRKSIAVALSRKKPEAEIVLEGQESGYVHVYSTHDEIKGKVNLKFEKDTTLDELIITFEGMSQTYVEKIASTAPTSGRTTGRHVFLKLLQPVDSDDLPEDNLLKAGQTYSVDFLFRVPPSLLPCVCSHKVDNESLRKDHLELPPSMGDTSICGDGHQLMDDIAPAMSRVSYGVRVRATSRLPSGKIIDAAERIEKVLIVPAKEEAPPVHIDDHSFYIMRKERAVKKGLFKIGKIGHITAETTQPKPLRLLHPHKRSAEPVTTTATINLRFDPQHEEDQPPTLGNIGSKIRVYTFFGAAPYKIQPEVHRCDNWSNLHGVYSEGVDLLSRNLSTVSWTRHEAGSDISRTTSCASDLARRPSTFSNSSNASFPEPSAAANPNLPFYTASVLVPVSLPTPTKSSEGSGPTATNFKTPKIFLPTFHSCIISRSYILDLALSWHSPGTSVSMPSITLKTPIQITAEGGIPPPTATSRLAAGFGVSEADEAVLLAEIEQQFNLNLEMGLESPNYEEVAPLLHAYRRSTVPNLFAGPGSTEEDSASPPDYAPNATPRPGGRGVVVGGARTMRVSAWA
jgi:hypothetical protein